MASTNSQSKFLKKVVDSAAKFSFKKKKPVSDILHTVVYYPAHAPVELVNKELKKLSHKKKRIVRVTIGCTFAFGGVIISKYVHLPTETVLHLIPDFVGYFLHGIGLAPLAKEIFVFLGYDEHEALEQDHKEIKKKEAKKNKVKKPDKEKIQ